MLFDHCYFFEFVWIVPTFSNLDAFWNLLSHFHLFVSLSTHVGNLFNPIFFSHNFLNLLCCQLDHSVLLSGVKERNILSVVCTSNSWLGFLRMLTIFMKIFTCLIIFIVFIIWIFRSLPLERWCIRSSTSLVIVCHSI